MKSEQNNKEVVLSLKEFEKMIDKIQELQRAVDALNNQIEAFNGFTTAKTGTNKYGK